MLICPELSLDVYRRIAFALEWMLKNKVVQEENGVLSLATKGLIAANVNLPFKFGYIIACAFL